MTNTNETAIFTILKSDAPTDAQRKKIMDALMESGRGYYAQVGHHSVYRNIDSHPLSRVEEDAMARGETPML